MTHNYMNDRVLLDTPGALPEVTNPYMISFSELPIDLSSVQGPLLDLPSGPQ
jgi:hypothetical protein